MGVALVTGAAGGIGRGIVARLAADGHEVVGVDVDDCDVSDANACTALVESVVAHHGRLDVLVNNAGTFNAVGFVHRLDPDAFDREVAVNLSGPFFLMRAAVGPMLQQGYGRIVNISSISSGGAYKQAAYGASKLGLISLTKTFANEFAPAGITVNAVLPGLTETDKVMAAPEDIRAIALATIPAGRMGGVRDVADLVAFLAREETAYITGAAIPVDGGAMTQQLRFGPRSRMATP
jgi:NAD(P)-dependent dehydrogenase (short-subunit alcohol dehydrogenase family)